MHRLKSHIQILVKDTPSHTPWVEMSICALATAAPLLLGWWFGPGQLFFAVNGALLGYFVALMDGSGSIVRRVMVASLSFVGMLLFFMIGVGVQSHYLLFFLIVLTMTYGLGWLGGAGGQLERLVLFLLIDVLVAYYTPQFQGFQLQQILVYALVAYGTLIVGILLSGWFTKAVKSVPLDFKRFVKDLSSRPGQHFFALSMSCAVAMAMSWVDYLALERRYWTVITVLLVMRSDGKASIYRSMQRLVGTVLGVLVGETTVHMMPYAEVLIAGVVFAAFLIPRALLRNYLVVSFLVSIVVMFLITIPTVEHPDPQVPYVRLIATFYGCVFGLFGVFINSLFLRFKCRTAQP